MRLFSSCSDKCCICSVGGRDAVCLAGHGDDDYYPATVEQVVQRLEEGMYKRDRDIMIRYLKSKGFEYKGE